MIFNVDPVFDESQNETGISSGPGCRKFPEKIAIS